MRIIRVLSTIFFLGIFCTAGAAYADTIDFSGFEHGTIMNTQISGVTISAENPNLTVLVGDIELDDFAIIFDSTETGTEDPDLEDPWDGGNLADEPIDLGNLLIISEDADGYEDGIMDDPDDEGSRPAGQLIFEFDFPITSLGFDLIDVESIAEEPGSVVVNGTERFFSEFDGASMSLGTVAFGNNSANRIDPFSISQPVTTVVFNLGGSGAIDNITYTRVPEPSAIALLGIGWLALLGTARRHRNPS